VVAGGSSPRRIDNNHTMNGATDWTADTSRESHATAGRSGSRSNSASRTIAPSSSVTSNKKKINRPDNESPYNRHASSKPSASESNTQKGSSSSSSLVSHYLSLRHPQDGRQIEGTIDAESSQDHADLLQVVQQLRASVC